MTSQYDSLSDRQAEPAEDVVLTIGDLASREDQVSRLSIMLDEGRYENEVAVLQKVIEGVEACQGNMQGASVQLQLELLSNLEDSLGQNSEGAASQVQLMVLAALAAEVSQVLQPCPTAAQLKKFVNALQQACKQPCAMQPVGEEMTTLTIEAWAGFKFYPKIESIHIGSDVYSRKDFDSITADDTTIVHGFRVQGPNCLDANMKKERLDYGKFPVLD